MIVLINQRHPVGTHFDAYCWIFEDQSESTASAKVEQNSGKGSQSQVSKKRKLEEIMNEEEASREKMIRKEETQSC